MLFFTNLYAGVLDASQDYQLGFQDPASATMEGIINFHNYIMVFIVAVLIFVFYLLKECLQDFVYQEKDAKDLAPLTPSSSLWRGDLVFTHSTELEVIWTLVPAFVLMIIAVPSFALLYSLEESVAPELTLKVIGHQWFWSYEYPEIATSVESSASALETPGAEKALAGPESLKLGFGGDVFGYDSYMLSENDLAAGAFRMLEVDKRIVLPVKTHIRVLVTAADVLHSWAVPSFGVKVDACPGRLNQASLYVKRTGLYYGQCSEICGVNHGFMPIAVKIVSKKDFLLDMELANWGSEEE